MKFLSMYCPYSLSMEFILRNIQRSHLCQAKHSFFFYLKITQLKQIMSQTTMKRKCRGEGKEIAPETVIRM
jgi:hypothetical protein